MKGNSLYMPFLVEKIEQAEVEKKIAIQQAEAEGVIDYLEQVIPEDILTSIAMCEHGKANPYHLENDVYSHTVLVTLKAKKMAEARELSPLDRDMLLLSAAYHDVGKPLTMFEKEGRRYFKGHEYASALLFLDAYNRGALDITRQQAELVASMVLYHTLSHNSVEKMFLSPFPFSKLLFLLEMADSAGRIMPKDRFLKDRQDRIKPSARFTGKGDIIYTFGVPASGKSFYTEQKEREGYFRVSHDKVVETLADKYNATYDEIYKEMRKNEKLKKEADVMFKKQLMTAKRHDKVIIDMTNLTKKSRRTHYNFFCRKYTHRVVIFLAPYSLIIERNRKRVEKNLAHIIPEMIKRAVVPSFSEGFSSIEIILSF